MLKKLLAYFHKHKYDPDRFDSLIAEGVTVSGNVDYVGSLVIKGLVMGNITPKGPANQKQTTAITISGEVVGDKIIADFIVVENKGQISTTQLIEARVQLLIKKGGSVRGTVHYGSISLQEGSTVNGVLKKIEGGLAQAEERRLSAAQVQLVKSTLGA